MPTPKEPNDTQLNIASYYRPAARLTLSAVIAICACAFLGLALQTLPLGDDLCRAAEIPVTDFPIPVQELPVGLANSVGWTYRHWSGRWAGVGLETILLPKVPERYPWLIIFLATAQAGLLYASLRLLGLQRVVALFYTALFALVLWSGLPDIQEAVFWASGVLESQFALPLAILLFSLLLAPQSQNSNVRAIRAGLAVVLAFLVPAFHELAGAVFVLVVGAGTVVAIRRRSSRRGLWIAVCVIAAISFAIVFAAPGNAVRASSIPHRGQTVRTLKLLAETLHFYLVPWCLDLKLWLLAVIICVDPSIGSIRKRFLAISPRAVGLLVVALLGLITLGMVAGLWNLGHWLPGRTLDLLYGVFLAGWIAIAFLLSLSLEGWSLDLAHRRALSSASLVLLAVAAVVSNNNITVLADVGSGRASKWHAELRQRFQLVRSSGPDSDVQLPPITVGSPNLKPGNISSDPTVLGNRCMAAYFGVRSVRTVTLPDDGHSGEESQKTRGVE